MKHDTINNRPPAALHRRHDVLSIGTYGGVEMSDSAFPIIVNLAMDARLEDAGLSKRELFAVLALQGLVARAFSTDTKEASRLAVIHADALILELAKVKP